MRRTFALWLLLFAAYAATLGLNAFGASEYGGDEREPERQRPPDRGHAPSARAMTICWTSSVPSPMVRIFASRYIRQTGYSSM